MECGGTWNVVVCDGGSGVEWLWNRVQNGVQ